MARVLVRVGKGETQPYGAQVVVMTAEQAAVLLPNSRVVRALGDDEYLDVPAVIAPADTVMQAAAEENDDAESEAEPATGEPEPEPAAGDAAPKPRRRARR